jgi:hypothetical protein
MRSKIKSKKVDSLTVYKTLNDFIDYMSVRGQDEIASEYLLSQMSYIVSNLTKKEQVEFFDGLCEQMRSMV